jgi:predicted aspartyl protease
VKFRISLWFVLLTLTSQWPATSSPRTGNCDQSHVSGTQLDPEHASQKDLPFQLSHGYLILVEGQIGTQSHLKFILDTGSSISIVDSKIADRLKLPRQSAETFNFDRKLAWERATLPEIRFGPIRATDIVVLVGHLRDYFEFAQNVDAIIGLDLMQLTNFTVDYDAKKIVFHSSTQGAPVTRDKLFYVFLEIQVQGHLLRLMVDTGFPSMLLFEERLRTRVADLRMTGNTSHVTVGGRLRAKLITLPGVVIGSTRIDLPVLLTKAPASDMVPGIVGVVGISPLNARRANFNFVERSFSWE